MQFMAVSSPISPFFEPGAPPPLLPILTAQTDLSYGSGLAFTLIAHEELPDRITSPRGPSAQPSGRVRFQSTTNSEDPSESSNGSDSEPDSSVASDDEGKIAKPHGEAGHPRSGGYNLERKLGWSKTGFKQLKVGRSQS